MIGFLFIAILFVVIVALENGATKKVSSTSVSIFDFVKKYFLIILFILLVLGYFIGASAK